MATLALILGWSLSWFCRNSRVWRWIAAGATALAFAAPGPVVGMAIVYAYRDAPRLDLGFSLHLGVETHAYEVIQRLKFSLL